MGVSDRDRACMERIGRLKAPGHAQAAALHRALPLAERLQRSWSLYVLFRDRSASAPRDDDPTPFYDRARALGLYRP